jgi:hypothetical protein
MAVRKAAHRGLAKSGSSGEFEGVADLMFGGGSGRGCGGRELVIESWGTEVLNLLALLVQKCKY